MIYLKSTIDWYLPSTTVILVLLLHVTFVFNESSISRLHGESYVDPDKSDDKIIHPEYHHRHREDQDKVANPYYSASIRAVSSVSNIISNDNELSQKKSGFGSAVVNVHHFTQFLYEGSQVYVYSAKLNEEYPQDPQKWSFFYVPVLQPAQPSINSDWVWVIKNEVRVQLALGNSDVENAARKAVANRYNDTIAVTYSKFWIIAPLMIDMLTGFIVDVSSSVVENVTPYQIANPNSMMIIFRFACTNNLSANSIAAHLLDGEYNIQVAFHFSGLFEVTTNMITITGSQLQTVLSKTIADGGNTNATYIHRSQATNFVGKYMANVKKMIYMEDPHSNTTSQLTDGLREEFAALFQQGINSAAEMEVNLQTYEQIWQSSDLNPDRVTSELNKLFTYNKSYSDAQNSSDKYFNYNKEFGFSSSINTAVSASGWGFSGSVSNSIDVGVTTADDKTTHDIASEKRIIDLLNQQSVETKFEGEKFIPKSFKVFRLTDITSRLEVALVAKQLAAEKINKAVTRIVAPITTPGSYMLNFLVGEIKLYSGKHLPSRHWLFCNGTFVSPKDYPRLFAVIGYNYGRHQSNSLMFKLPDLRGRVPIGVDESQLRARGFRELGNEGGNFNHTLTTRQLPAHNHEKGTYMTDNSGSHAHSVNDPGHNHGGKTSAYATPASGSATHYGTLLQTANNQYMQRTEALIINTGTTGIVVNPNGNHAHTIVGQSGSTGNGEAFTILPPVQAFYYIIYAGETN